MMKEEKKGNFLKNICMGILIFVLIICITVAIMYIIFNYKIYKLIQNSEQEEIKIEYNCKYLTISNKNIQNMKSINKPIYIVKDNCEIELELNNLSNFIVLDVDKQYIEDVSGVFNNQTYCKINIVNNTDITNIKSINIDIDKNIIDSEIVDIYTTFKDKYMSAKSIKNGKIRIIPSKDNIQYNEFFVVYIPLEQIKLGETKIRINKGESKGLKLELIPSNSTNKELQFSIKEDNIIKISKSNEIIGKTAGKTSVVIGVKGESVKNNLEVEVIPILEKINLNKNSLTMYVGDNTTIKATVVPADAVNKKLEWSSTDTKIATVKDGKITAKKAGTCKIVVKNIGGSIIEKKITVKVINKPKKTVSTSSTSKNVTTNSSASANINTSSSTKITYIQGILVVNKKYALPSNYNPGVNGTAYNALVSLQKAAKSAGYKIPLLSGFRSYNAQKKLYNKYVKQYGQATADTFSARPGHSEHQTGLAFDVGSISDNYGNTAAGKWLAKNCHKYGFIIRYPKGKKSKTGYKYEPWHIRYVGVNMATNIYNSGLCLEEYLGI